MTELATQVLVVGGGPGGYEAAARAGALGLDVVLVEERALGGTCLQVGCIPSKALIHVAEAFDHAARQAQDSPFGLIVQPPRIDLARTVEWKDGIVARLQGGVAGLMKRHKVKILEGRAVMRDGKTCEVETDTGAWTVRAEHVVLATGSVPVELPALPFGGRVISSTEALSLTALPGRLVVVGAGYIGLELGIAYARMGTAVTVVEAADRILPHYDEELTRPVARRLEELGAEVLTGAVADGLSSDGEGLRVTLADGRERRLAGDHFLVAIGRRARTTGFGLEELDLAMQGGFVRIDERCATSMRNVWAIGDLTGEPMLAHRAMAQGRVVAEIIAGRRRVFDPVAIPAICFTDPEVVSAGLSPDEARATGRDISVGRSSFQASGRALTLAAGQGFVRVTARADNHLVLGIQAVGPGVSELAAAFGLALEMGARLEDIAGTVHAHPTLGETFQEAAIRAAGEAAHG